MYKTPLLQIDYTKSASNVYGNAVCHFLQEDFGGTEHFGVLSLASNEFATDQDSMPSWIPRWDKNTGSPPILAGSPLRSKWVASKGQQTNFNHLLQQLNPKKMSAPNLSSELQGLDIGGDFEPARFPAHTKHAAGLVIEYKPMLRRQNLDHDFSRRTIVTIQVPLSSASPTTFDTALASDNEDMLLLGHLTPKTLLGAGGEQREAVEHLYASQIAIAIATRNPEETRTVLRTRNTSSTTELGGGNLPVIE
ncbi:uncharacterized protein PAC_14606 [Phialocephala subalpina]|uniref:Uncharacterized protein n=1 Tax=Phialocephala subalpina TaxID=576137 RepID=A0A1L7XIC2_9HELO|nr:uncharacterized protein PAC_14606 [Phialocephala subalpina]